MNRSQMVWASCHDWYVDAGYKSRAGYMVRVRDSQTNEVSEFTCFSKLKVWAGY